MLPKPGARQPSLDIRGLLSGLPNDRKRRRRSMNSVHIFVEDSGLGLSTRLTLIWGA